MTDIFPATLSSSPTPTPHDTSGTDAQGASKASPTAVVKDTAPASTETQSQKTKTGKGLVSSQLVGDDIMSK